MFDIKEFNDLYNAGDLLALEYLKDFIPKDLEDKYEAILEFNYVNSSFESGLLSGSVYDIYRENLLSFFESLGIVYIVSGSCDRFMQNKLIRRVDRNE